MATTLDYKGSTRPTRLSWPVRPIRAARERGTDRGPVRRAQRWDEEAKATGTETADYPSTSGASCNGAIGGPAQWRKTYSLKGQSTGIKYRGGAPPAPPAWQCTTGDLRAFKKWEKRVQMWLLQVVNYIPKKEAGIHFYNSLKGELEEELEDAPVERIYDLNGVSFIVDTIRKAVETRSVHLKRRLLADYEHIYRGPQESLRQYINRYQRTERSLNTVSINVEKMYDKEARGSRLLERSKLSHEHQRQVLIGTMQSLDFDNVKDVLLFQWPDHRPPPPPVDRQPEKRPFRPFNSGSKGDGKGKSKDKRGEPPRKAYITENENEQSEVPQEDDERLDAIPEEDDPSVEDELREPEGDDQEDQDDLSNEIQTITARKLSGIVQARKFGNPPGAKKSIQDRKRNSHCAACGARGHWQGDPECPVSDKSKKGSGRSSSAGGPPSSSGSKDEKSSFRKDAKSVYFLNVTSEHSEDEHDEIEAHQIFMVHTDSEPSQVRLADANKAAGYLILDTACQRTCAGRQWASSHHAKLHNNDLPTFNISTQESFEFGMGPTIVADTAWCFPVSLHNHLCTIVACILDANIPCLASRPWMTEVGAIIDLGSQTITFTKFGSTAPLQMVNGHIAVKISDFTVDQAKAWRACYHEVERCLQDTPTAEFAVLPHETGLKSIPSHQAISHERRLEDITGMASSLEVLGVQGHRMDEAGHLLHESHQPHDIGIQLNGVDYGTKEQGKGKGTSSGAAITDPSSGRMSTPPRQALRQPERVLRPMPGLQHEVEVEPRSPRLGALRRGIQFITLATTFLNHCLGQFVATGTSSTPSLSEIQGFGIPQADRSEEHNLEASAGSARHLRRLQRLGSAEPTNGALQPGIRDGGAHRVRLGERRRLSRQLKTSSDVLAAELSIYDDLPAALNTPSMDLMELYAGNAEITFLAERYGLKALQPFDLIYNHDMKLSSNKELWRAAQRKFNPLVVIVETDCQHWNLFNENLNYRGKDRLEELNRLRQGRRPLVKLGAEACETQINNGNIFLMENPARSRFWDLPEIQRLALRDDVYVVQGYSGAYGATNSKGDPIKKTFQWLTNSKELADAVSRKMSDAELQFCVPLQGGKEVQLSARYPTKLCKAILQAIRVEARRRTPQRFMIPKQIFYAEIMEDPATWTEALNQVEKMFETTTSRSLVLSDHDPLHRQIVDLVPWEMTRVQLTRAPVQRRLPRDIFYTHRGAAIQYQDGRISIEAEPLDGMHFPKQRFKQAVAYAIFWYGYGNPAHIKPKDPPQDATADATSAAPQDATMTASADAGHVNPRGPTSMQQAGMTTVTFPGCPAEVPSDTRSAVARLHLNLGHPTEKELLRLLAWQGAISKHMITAVKHLQCASCNRLKKHLQPRPSAMPVGPTSSTAATSRATIMPSWASSTSRPCFTRLFALRR